MTVFETSWSRAWSGLGCRGDGAALRVELLRRYSEAHRAYHTVQHLQECLDAFEAVQGIARYPQDIEMALWFHDAIYEVRRSDNERLSADWARTALLEAGASADAAARVHALIMATLHTAVPTDPDALLLVDIDLGILGAGEARFAEYERQIRQEYHHVPGLLFQFKRREILRTFLNRSRLYSTSHFHDRLEAQARINLRRAVA